MLRLVYQHRCCLQGFSVALCRVAAQFSLLDGLTQTAFCRWGQITSIHHTRIRVDGSPSYGLPFGAPFVHVGRVVEFSFYRGGPTTLLSQQSILSAVVGYPIEFSTSLCKSSQLRRRCPFSIAHVPSKQLIAQ